VVGVDDFNIPNPSSSHYCSLLATIGEEGRQNWYGHKLAGLMEVSAGTMYSQ
jgi:hypothetical protein